MPEPAQSLLMSACLGALMGLIRQWETQQDAEKVVEFAGVRTFAILAMLGSVAAFASDEGATGVFAGTVVVLGILLMVVPLTRPGDRQVGYTTSGAALLAFFCGALVHWQQRQAAVLLTAVTMLLVGLKQPIHQWTRRFTAQDVRSVLQFVAITGVILPLVPNRDYGPFGAFNPWSTWLMVVLISGLGFMGYLLARLLGNQSGITIAGLVGGLASSTAATLAFSRRSREDPEHSDQYALAIALACNVMLVRVLIVAAAIHPILIASLWIPLLAMGFPGTGYAVWMWLRRRRESTRVETPTMGNPLTLSIALKFGALYAAVRFLVKAATGLGFATGVIALSAIAGLTDLDAITVSSAQSAREASLSNVLATLAVTTGCISNTIVKGFMAAAFGSGELRKIILAVLGSTAAAGGLSLLLFV